MNNEWNEAIDAANEATGGMYLKLPNDGDSIVGVFVGKPIKRKVKWVEGSGFVQDDTGNWRFWLNLYVPAENSTKVWETSKTTMQAVGAALTKYGEGCSFEIKRSGTGKETKYGVMYEDKLSDSVAKEIAQATEHNLAAIADGDLPF